MLKKFLKVLLFIWLVIMLGYFLTHRNMWKIAFLDTTKLWLYNVACAIIPMYILTSLLLINPLFSKLIFKIIKNKHKFENQKALSLFLLSFLVGNPTSTIMIKKAYLKKEISLAQANDLIASCSHVSFFFVLIFLEKKLALSLIIIQIMVTFILYFKKPKKALFNTSLSSSSYLDAVNEIIEDCPLMLLKILMTMLIVVIIKLPFTNNLFLKTISAFLEVTTGIDSIIKMNLTKSKTFIFLNILLSFNGVAILLQVFNVIKKTKLSFKKYLKGRLLHAIITFIFSLGYLYLLKFFF